MIKVSCIIPTYNEAARIANVLRVVENHPLIHEIIVVDDGSIDNTREIVSTFKNIRLIVHEKNKGKSAAIHRGVSSITGEFVLFLDADLVGLTVENINELISPITSGMADVSISYRGNSPRLWRLVGFDYISGERVFHREILQSHLDKILELPKFGLEIFLNSLIIKNNSRIKIVEWPNVSSPFKYAKYGMWKGIKGDIGMMRDIFTTFSIFEPLSQIIKMKHLVVN